MGWLYMTSLKGHDGPRRYLDAQFTYERADHRSRVLKSALVKMRVYYAGVECVDKLSGSREVWALVCLVDYNPRDPEGYIFGYKEQCESMGPNESECPKTILDLLTPTEDVTAIEWRRRCRDSAVYRSARARKPSPQPGQTIFFDRPIAFADGRSYSELQVVADPRKKRRSVLFRDPKSGTLYKITKIKDRNYHLRASGAHGTVTLKPADSRECRVDTAP